MSQNRYYVAIATYSGKRGHSLHARSTTKKSVVVSAICFIFAHYTYPMLAVPSPIVTPLDPMYSTVAPPDPMVAPPSPISPTMASHDYVPYGGSMGGPTPRYVPCGGFA